MRVLKVSAGQTAVQKMGVFKKDKWSGDAQLFWSGGKKGETLTLALEVGATGKYDVSAVLTMAADYATVQFAIDDKPLGEPLDLYNSPDVITTGVQKLGRVELKEGTHHLTIKITGANPLGGAEVHGRPRLPPVGTSEVAPRRITPHHDPHRYCCAGRTRGLSRRLTRDVRQSR